MSKTTTLRALAASLPQVMKTDEAGNPFMIKRRVKGASLISRGQTKLKTGEVIKPMGEYVMDMPLLVDHYEELKKIERKMGWPYVEAYCLKIRELEATENPNRIKKTQRRDPKTIEVKQGRRIKPTFKQRTKEFFRRLRIEIKIFFKTIFKKRRKNGVHKG